MDKIKKHQKAILDSLEEYKSQFKKISYDMHPHVIADEKKTPLPIFMDGLERR